MDADDTIAAVATAAGRGAIGVVRVSGPAVPDIAHGLLGRDLPPRHAWLGDFRDAQGQPIDRGIALYFPAPASYTGEHVLELQGHGGPVVLQLVLRRCLELGARLAEPGEFTRRAFLNGKLDLAQAEAVADLIDASTERAARCAARSLAGELSKRVAALQQALTDVRVLFEASFDFPEEELDVLTETDALQKLRQLETLFADTLRAAEQGKLLREGVTVALSGAPNVGKSSIINSLSEEEVAIVTPIPGTTRDLVRATVAIEGIPVVLIDTAGLRETEDLVESIGVARAREAARTADVVLRVTDCSREAAGETFPLETLAKVVHVHNKIDLVGAAPRMSTIDGETHVWVSATEGAGIELLKRAIVEAVGADGTAEGVFAARARHIECLTTAERHVREAVRQAGVPEFAAEELRLAQAALSRITGEHVADDLLGEIFSRFCIGK